MPYSLQNVSDTNSSSFPVHRIFDCDENVPTLVRKRKRIENIDSNAKYEYNGGEIASVKHNKLVTFRKVDAFSHRIKSNHFLKIHPKFVNNDLIQFFISIIDKIG